MSGHLDGPRPPKLPGPPDPPYIEGDLGSPSREEFDIQRGAANADVTYEHPKGCDPATVVQRRDALPNFEGSYATPRPTIQMSRRSCATATRSKRLRRCLAGQSRSPARCLNLALLRRLRRREMHTLAGVPLSDDTAKRLTSAGRHHRRWREQRDELIRIAYQEGAGPREISRLVGLSHPAVISIIRQQPPLFGRSTEDPDVEPTS